jgi:hypothetical protein
MLHSYLRTYGTILICGHIYLLNTVLTCTTCITVSVSVRTVQVTVVMYVCIISEYTKCSLYLLQSFFSDSVPWYRYVCAHMCVTCSVCILICTDSLLQYGCYAINATNFYFIFI